MPPTDIAVLPALVEPPADDARGEPRPPWTMVLAAVAIALLWPLLWATSQGTADALLGAGDLGPSRPFIESEIPDLAPLEGIGHDGQQFYVIARHPFDPTAADGAIDEPAYRYRRILFPLVSGAIAPGGGRPLIWAFLALSTLGVALGARALQRMGGGPRWLPLLAALNPGVIISLTLSLSDAFGSGLALMSVALATRRRWAAAIAFAVLAALTRETLVIVGLALAFTPGMPRPWRAAAAIVPGVAVAGWMLWLAGQLPGSTLDGSAKQMALPFTGYFTGAADAEAMFMAALALVLLVGGAWVTRHRAPHVAAVLGLQAVLLACVSDLVAFDWANSVRTAAPMLPLALWAILTRTTFDVTDS